MSELVKSRKPAIEGKVVKPIRVPLNIVQFSEVANWPEGYDSAPTYGGVTRSTVSEMNDFMPYPDVPPGVFEMQKVLRDTIDRMCGAEPIQPASIDKATPAYKFGIDHAQAGTDRTVEQYRPNFWQRMHGYTANPATCGHHRKRFKTRWTCADCGDDL